MLGSSTPEVLSPGYLSLTILYKHADQDVTESVVLLHFPQDWTRRFRLGGSHHPVAIIVGRGC